MSTTGCSSVRKSARFGSETSLVRIQPPRPLGHNGPVDGLVIRRRDAGVAPRVKRSTGFDSRVVHLNRPAYWIMVRQAAIVASSSASALELVTSNPPRVRAPGGYLQRPLARWRKGEFESPLADIYSRVGRAIRVRGCNGAVGVWAWAHSKGPTQKASGSTHRDAGLGGLNPPRPRPFLLRRGAVV